MNPAASGYPGNVALCMHCGLSIVRGGSVTGITQQTFWQDTKQSVTCDGGQLAHTPFPAGFGLRGEPR